MGKWIGTLTSLKFVWQPLHIEASVPARIGQLRNSLWLNKTFLFDISVWNIEILSYEIRFLLFTLPRFHSGRGPSRLSSTSYQLWFLISNVVSIYLMVPILPSIFPTDDLEVSLCTFYLQYVLRVLESWSLLSSL